ncbi:MAG: phosphoribosylformylglycinamidine synthase I [Candidatus Omnitrophica bacterium]|nr:phosphoribosylformylglycinamidine synthase I [Candidatus Omnitrophota bacterium]
MKNRVKVIVLRSAGTNCDKETAFAFKSAGAEAELVHINELCSGKKSLSSYQILAIPGGFSYGDDLGAGKILSVELKHSLRDDLRGFIAGGKLIIGICNGFQVLARAGLLPGNGDFTQEATLMLNTSGKFEDRWTYLKSRNDTLCVWTRNLPEIIYLPVAHGEGNFQVKDKAALERIKGNGQVVFQYCTEYGNPAGYPYNPNGSVDNIAGICDKTGRILGLMPHPERHVQKTQGPRWASMKEPFGPEGIQIFKNGVEYAKKNLLS